MNYTHVIIMRDDQNWSSRAWLKVGSFYYYNVSPSSGRTSKNMIHKVMGNIENVVALHNGNQNARIEITAFSVEIVGLYDPFST